jgi:hypothetical protein
MNSLIRIIIDGNMIKTVTILSRDIVTIDEVWIGDWIY